jgi:hypothetical protein
MALAGQGVLAIWNGMADGTDADFIAWHVQEHIPERVGLPGFLRGRRYVARDGHPKYFNFYEAETADVFTSAPYRARLNDPTPWSRKVMVHFTDTSRTACEVAASFGCGEGAWIETIRMSAVVPTGAFTRKLIADVLPDILAQTGIVGVHLLQGRPSDSRGTTLETTLRGGPDQVADWILLIEAVEPEPVDALRSGAVANEALRACGAEEIERGLYRLQFALTKAETNAAR